MRDGNQYVGVTLNPRSGKSQIHPDGRGTLVGASKIPQLQRPWNPWWVGDTHSPETEETARFKDADADFIAHAPTDLAFLLSELDRLIREKEEAAAAERERCAKIAEGFVLIGPHPVSAAMGSGWSDAATRIASAIRSPDTGA
jgi:hypothetical protein